MTPRLALLLGLGASAGLGTGTLAGFGTGHIPLLQPSRTEAGPWSRPALSPDGAQRVSTRAVSFTGSPHLSERAWQVDLTNMGTGQHLVLELPGPTGEVGWEGRHTLVVRRGELELGVEWSGH